MNNLSEEEKKAIEALFHLAHINTYLDLEKENVVKVSSDIIKKWKDETKIVLNLIEKQQKEIEELKEVKWYYEISRVPKDKIRAKIKELEEEKNISEGMYIKAFYRIKDLKNIEIAVLESLLEED